MPVVALAREVQSARPPDDHGADERHQREEGCQHAEHERGGQPRDPEADADEHALHQRRHADAHEHGARDLLEVLPQLAAHALLDRQHAHDLLRERRPVAQHEEQHEQHQQEADQRAERAEHERAAGGGEELQHVLARCNEPVLDLDDRDARVLPEPVERLLQPRHVRQVQ